MDLQNQTPREIDEALSAIYTRIHRIGGQIASVVEMAHRAAGDRQRYIGRRAHWGMTDQEALTVCETKAVDETVPAHMRRRAESALNEHKAALDDRAKAIGDADVYNAEFDRRGGWSRFFMVPGGHIHSSMHCSTCFPTTQFGWLPSVSGKTEKEAVAEHGPLLCTVCFPSAPVEWTIGRQTADEGTCPGSGTFDYPAETARRGYVTGNYGVCNRCGERATTTSTGKMRKHKTPQS